MMQVLFTSSPTIAQITEQKKLFVLFVMLAINVFHKINFK